MFKTVRTCGAALTVAAALSFALAPTSSAAQADVNRGASDALNAYTKAVKCEEVKKSAPHNWFQAPSCIVSALPGPRADNACWVDIAKGVVIGAGSGASAEALKQVIGSSFDAVKFGAAAGAGAIIAIDVAAAQSSACKADTDASRDYNRGYAKELNALTK